MTRTRVLVPLWVAAMACSASRSPAVDAAVVATADGWPTMQQGGLPDAGALDATPAQDAAAPPPQELSKYPGPCSSETRDADGILSSRIVYHYDGADLQTEWDQDRDGDGVFDQKVSFGYDAHGNRILREDDIDLDGIADRRTTYTYDDDDLLVQQDMDDDADGLLESRITYSHDDQGRFIRTERDDGVDGSLDCVTERSYPDASTILWDTDCPLDGVLDSRVTFTLDTLGNPTRIEHDAGRDGTPELVETRGYDTAGNLLTQDIEAGGMPDSATTYSYDCWQ